MERDNLVHTSILILRIAIGIIFMAHGMQKLFGAFGGSGIEGFSGMLQSMGFTAPVFWAWAAGLAEGAGGLFILLGIFPRISAGFIAIVMIVAILKVHLAKGFFAGQGGFEYLYLILSTCITLILTGAGKFSLYNRF